MRLDAACRLCLKPRSRFRRFGFHRPERCAALLSLERGAGGCYWPVSCRRRAGATRDRRTRIRQLPAGRKARCQELLSPGKNGRNWGGGAPKPQAERLSRKKCDKGNELRYVGAPAMGRPSLKGCSSIGRASVSKTEGWGFETLRPCQVLVCAH